MLGKQEARSSKEPLGKLETWSQKTKEIRNKGWGLRPHLVCVKPGIHTQHPINKQTSHPSTQEVEMGDQEFKVIFGYKVSFRAT